MQPTQHVEPRQYTGCVLQQQQQSLTQIQEQEILKMQQIQQMQQILQMQQMTMLSNMQMNPMDGNQINTNTMDTMNGRNNDNNDNDTEMIHNKVLNVSTEDLNYLFKKKKLSVLDEHIERQIYNQLLTQSKANDMAFAAQISQFSRKLQFIFTAERWAQQVHNAQMNLSAVVHHNQHNHSADHIRLPIGSFIHSTKSDTYYLNLGVEAKTLQGCIYIGYEYCDAFITKVLSDGYPNFSTLISLAIKPTLAIKYYDKKCCDLGVTLNGIPVKEKATQEIKMTKSIYRNAYCNPKLNKPLLPWLQEPHKNVIKLIEHWEDINRKCYFMVTEFANCGELLLFVDAYHSIIYREKKQNIQRIDEIKNNKLRDLSIRVYKQSIRTSADGSNAYIELVRFMFQQMVQAVYTLHCQGIAHLDISCENFVLHFDENGQFLAKLIDFGRATKVKRDNDECNEYEYEYQRYDFTLSTYPGKCRYMSPEAALFLKYKDADPYDASKEDIYALGIVLFCLLTCTLPYDTPFYIQEDDAYPNQYGYLNGNKKYKIDLHTMTYIRTGETVNQEEIDPSFMYLQQRGVANLLHENCLLDYVSNDSLDLLNQIFTKRLSLKELINHPFVKTPPNPHLLVSMIQHVVDYKRLEYLDQQKHIEITRQQINTLYQNRLRIEAEYISRINEIKNKQKQQPPIIETSLNQPVIVASPSPPPHPNYTCSPSPDVASFSPSPDTFMAASSDIINSTSNITNISSVSTGSNITNNDSATHHDHSNLIHNLLEAHFQITCSQE